MQELLPARSYSSFTMYWGSACRGLLPLLHSACRNYFLPRLSGACRGLLPFCFTQCRNYFLPGLIALSQCIGVVHVEGFCHYFTPRAGTTSCPVLAARHRRRKQGGRGAFAPEKNCLVGSLPPRKCGTDGHVNLTQQLSPCSMGQSGTVALVGFAFEAIF